MDGWVLVVVVVVVGCWVKLFSEEGGLAAAGRGKWSLDYKHIYTAII
jgi:hypothetical protein